MRTGRMDLIGMYLREFVWGGGGLIYDIQFEFGLAVREGGVVKGRSMSR